MNQKNVFEMLGLEFDPPDSLKKIQAAHVDWKKRLTAEQNTTVDSARLAVIKSELEMDNYITQVIENPRLRQREAESLKQTRIEQLRGYIDLLRGENPGTLQVNHSQIKQLKEKLKLSPATIEATYKEQGFEIKKERTNKSVVEVLNNFFISDSVMDELRKNFADFQKVPDEKNYPWSANVHNFYELAYYLENQTEPSADFYRRRDCEELCRIFNEEAKKVSAPITAWQSIKALLNLAQTQIFNSDANRFKYDHSLKVEGLKDFFAKIKTAPEIFKRDKFFADNCITRIRQTFPNLLNYELSAALYNKAAGLLKNPYESTNNAIENFFCMTCANCGAIENFRTREEAENAACKICGTKFFDDCPKCGKKIPANVDHCPSCEFSLSELRRCDYYIAYANSMLDLIERGAKSLDDDVKNVMAEVIKTIAKIKLVRPESPDAAKIEWRINKINSEFRKREDIQRAETKMPGLGMSPERAVAACLEILRMIPDYKPAQERLRIIKPKKPLKVGATVKGNVLQNPSGAAILKKISVNAKSTGAATTAFNFTFMVSWQPANDLGIFYTVVRKIDGVPRTYHDGEIIAEKTDKLEVEDTNVKPGILYGYAVFAERYGSVSEPATCKIVHYSDLEPNKFIAKTESGHCRFTWKLPADNCLGVRILRSDSAGSSVVVADCVQSPFVDRSVKNRMQYQYTLQCVYHSAEETVANRERFLAKAGDETFNTVWRDNRTRKYSHGLTVTLTPELPPRLIKNFSFDVVDGRIKFFWQPTGDFDIWFKEIPDDKKISVASAKKIFELNKIDELLGSGLVLRRASSSEKFCELDMSEELMKIAVVSATTNLGILNEIITAANFEPCRIDDAKTKIEGNNLKLVLKTLPKNIYRIHYKINTEDSEDLYSTIDDAKNWHMNRTFAAQYAQDGFILQPHLPQKKLYVTVIGEYKLEDGTAIFSPPDKFILNNRPKSEIFYRLEWGMSGLFNKKAQAKNCKLILESDAETPSLFLVYEKNSSQQLLHMVRAYDDGFPNHRLEVLLPNDIWQDVLPGTLVKLVTSKDDEKFFNLKSSKPESLIVPKK